LPSPSGRRGTALAVDEVENAWIYITFYLSKNDLIRLVPRHLLQPEKALEICVLFKILQKFDSDVAHIFIDFHSGML